MIFNLLLHLAEESSVHLTQQFTQKSTNQFFRNNKSYLRIENIIIVDSRRASAA